MNGLRIFWARKLTTYFFGGAFLMLLGCSTDSSNTVNNSQTHWLSVCTEDSDCGDLSCICGICTDECSSSGSCSGFSEDATCASADGNGACGKTAPEKVCLAPCQDDDACSNGATCESGVCSPSGASSDLPTDPATGEPGAGSDSGASAVGLVCADYPTCGVDGEPCETGTDCIGFSECGSGICVPFEEACELSCESAQCALLESYPAQLQCEGGDLVAPQPGEMDPVTGTPVDGGAHGGSDGSSDTPSGVNCDIYPACGVGAGQCEDGVNCIAIVGCPNAICIKADEACAQSCPNPADCAIAESYPEQLSCEGRVPGHSDAAASDGGMCIADNETGCGQGSSCCAGLECCQGIPYPAEGQCSDSCDLKSDRNVKHNIAPVDAEQVLNKVSALSIGTWSYDSEPGVRHLGPMAQDFKAAFGLGASDLSISTVDAVGVALTAIQALNQRVEALERENAALREAALGEVNREKKTLRVK